MAQSFHFGSGNVAYAHLLRDFRIFSRQVSPRGFPTLEVEDCSVTVSDARYAVPLGTSRKVRTAIGVAEYCQLLAGVSFLEQLDAASGGNFSQFADDGKLRGAYGPRLYHQLRNVAARLEEDPDSRQAVASVWGNEGEEVGCKFRDTPCTLAFQFRLRDGVLNMTAVMRSSDVWLGLPYDLWMFSRLQMTMAWALGVNPGSLTVFAGSMHLYQRDFDGARRVELFAGSPDEVMIPPAITLEGHGSFSAAERVGVAQAAALGAVLGWPVPDDASHASLAWNAGKLPHPAGEWYLCRSCRYISSSKVCKECQ